MRALLATVISGSLIIVAQAQEHDAQYGKCIEAETGGSITQQVEGCYEQENDRDDKVLNQVFQRLRAKLPNDRRRAMVEAQKSWLQYRTLWCAFAETSDQAPSHTANKDICISEVTKAQIARLKEQLE